MDLKDIQRGPGSNGNERLIPDSPGADTSFWRGLAPPQGIQPAYYKPHQQVREQESNIELNICSQFVLSVVHLSGCVQFVRYSWTPAMISRNVLKARWDRIRHPFNGDILEGEERVTDEEKREREREEEVNHRISET